MHIIPYKGCSRGPKLGTWLSSVLVINKHLSHHHESTHPILHTHGYAYRFGEDRYEFVFVAETQVHIFENMYTHTHGDEYEFSEDV